MEYYATVTTAGLGMTAFEGFFFLLMVPQNWFPPQSCLEIILVPGIIVALLLPRTLASLSTPKALAEAEPIDLHRASLAMRHVEPIILDDKLVRGCPVSCICLSPIQHSTCLAHTRTHTPHSLNLCASSI